MSDTFPYPGISTENDQHVIKWDNFHIILSVPDELLVKIFQKLDPKTYVKVRSSSKCLSQIAVDYSRQLSFSSSIKVTIGEIKDNGPKKFPTIPVYIHNRNRISSTIGVPIEVAVDILAGFTIQHLEIEAWTMSTKTAWRNGHIQSAILPIFSKRKWKDTVLKLNCWIPPYFVNMIQPHAMKTRSLNTPIPRSLSFFRCVCDHQPNENLLKLADNLYRLKIRCDRDNCPAMISLSRYIVKNLDKPRLAQVDLENMIRRPFVYEDDPIEYYNQVVAHEFLMEAIGSSSVFTSLNFHSAAGDYYQQGGHEVLYGRVRYYATTEGGNLIFLEVIFSQEMDDDTWEPQEFVHFSLWMSRHNERIARNSPSR